MIREANWTPEEFELLLPFRIYLTLNWLLSFRQGLQEQWRPSVRVSTLLT